MCSGSGSRSRAAAGRFRRAPTDVLLVVAGFVLLGIILAAGILFLHIHTLPERMAHKSQKLQFEIVAVLGLLALFTHIHLFWVAALILAMVDLPDFSSPLHRIAASTEKLAGIDPEDVEPPPPALLPSVDSRPPDPRPPSSPPKEAGNA